MSKWTCQRPYSVPENIQKIVFFTNILSFSLELNHLCCLILLFWWAGIISTDIGLKSQFQHVQIKIYWDFEHWSLVFKKNQLVFFVKLSILKKMVKYQKN